MSLTASDVEKIARLARLEISPEMVQDYTRQLSGILEFVEQMNAVDTSQVAPLAHPLDLSCRLRPDEITETDHRDEFLALAPATAAGLFLVPKVIE